MTTTTSVTPTDARCTPRMRSLLAGIRADVARGLPPGDTSALVGERLAGHLGATDLLAAAHCEGDPNSYRQHVLHAEPDGSFSLAALVWLPGQHTPIHDHVSWCVAGVHRGREHEVRFALLPDDDGARLVVTGEAVNAQGSVSAFAPPGDIHLVRNPGPGAAISLHVYGADLARLTTSIRRVYRLPLHRPPLHRR
ncbi:cysteine dioxygenase family protein [Kitasatospora paranensis]|uniref:Cysteine dioxygenase family protein n=1 Tax=Kitasatospora paranensis TaxID=258053 RepID=A0ABW2FX28_9ACTN